MSGAPEGYVDVAARIGKFFERYPEGSLCAKEPWRVVEVGDKTFISYSALAFRTPDDPAPGEGTAWEPFPGPTNFTRDSELQNAETSAWGRALAALGFEVKQGIATGQDVAARGGDTSRRQATGNANGVISEAQAKRLWAIARDSGASQADVKRVIQEVAGVERTEVITRAKYDAVIEALQVKS